MTYNNYSISVLIPTTRYKAITFKKIKSQLIVYLDAELRSHLQLTAERKLY